MALTPKFRSTLRSEANSLKPIVMVGREGVDGGVVKMLDEALTSHELVKAKFVGHKDEADELSAELAARTGSELVAVTGFVAIFYRKNPEDKE